MKITLAGFIVLLSVPWNCQATEGGGSNYLPGFYGDFGMGVMPSQGYYFNNFMTAYQNASGQIGTLMELPGLVAVTNFKIFGGDYIAAIYPGVVVSKDYGGSPNRNRFGAADAYLMPLAVHWHWDGLDIFAYEGIIVPSGYYEKGAVNTGRNIWTFDHNLSLTVPLPKDNEVSVNLGYMNNTVNDATRYASGDEFHFDYMVGHYLRPDLGIGVTGSYYCQTTADSAPANILASEYSKASSIGPVVTFTPKIGDRDIAMSLKWLREFDVEGRADQEYLVWKLMMRY